MKKKSIIIILISVLVLGALGYFVYPLIFESGVTEPKKVTVEVPKISTNLGDSSIISIGMTFTVETADETKALKETTDNMYQIKDEINLFVKNYTIDSFSTEANINMFKNDLMLRVNKILKDGKVIYIDITSLYYQ